MFILLLESIFFWPIIFAFVLLCVSTFLFEARYYGWTIFMMVAIAASFVFLGKEPLREAWTAGGFISTAATYLAYWVIAGLATSVAMWLYIIRRAARFVSDVEPMSNDEAYSAICNDSPNQVERSIGTRQLSDYAIKLAHLIVAAKKYCTRFGVLTRFGSPQNKLGEQVKSMEELEEWAQMKIEDVFPPKAYHNKWNLAAAAIVWPSTLLWLALYGVLNELWHYAFKLARATLDLVSSTLFPSMGLETADQRAARNSHSN